MDINNPIDYGVHVCCSPEGISALEVCWNSITTTAATNTTTTAGWPVHCPTNSDNAFMGLNFFEFFGVSTSLVHLLFSILYKLTMP